MKRIGNASFSVSSRVALQLGRESISSSITAIVELVKNAYDADAGVVSIRFVDLGGDQPYMVIEDTGNGMTVEELKRNWMVIGTANKSRNKKTKKRRIVTGEKGLGRLGLDRLCTNTTLDSKKENTSEGVRLVIGWEKYEGNEERLESVEHDLYSIDSLGSLPLCGQDVEYPHGTRLTLTGLKDRWDDEAIQRLRTELALLVSPFQGVNDFAIYIDTEAFYKSLDGCIEIQEPLLDSANWKVVSKLNADGCVSISMSSPRHEQIYELPPTAWADVIKRQGDLPLCGPLEFSFFFFKRADAELNNRSLKTTEIRDFLKFNQGIRIYRDGFRVKPYGEPDGSGDWLKLAFRRMQNPGGVTQQNWRVGYNQIVGAVFISNEHNAQLGDQTNREGLLHGPAFDHLQAYATRVIQFFEAKSIQFETDNREPTPLSGQAEEKAQSSINSLSRVLKDIDELAQRLPVADDAEQSVSGSVGVSKGSSIKELVDQARQELVRASADLEASSKLYKASEEQKNTMANLASLGIMAAAFGHESLDWTGTVAKNIKWLKNGLVAELFMVNLNMKDEIATMLSDTEKEAQKIRKFAKFTIGNVGRDKRTLKVFDLGKTVRSVFEAFDDVLSVQRNTSVDLSGIPSDACCIEGFEMDWESIVVNLITNASWALEDKPKSSRNIRVSICAALGGYWELVFEDSGIGLEAGTEQMIFLPAFSTKRSKRGEIVGTGMGLFIIKSFVEEHSGGTIEAYAKGELGGARFVIRVPVVN